MLNSVNGIVPQFLTPLVGVEEAFMHKKYNCIALLYPYLYGLYYLYCIVLYFTVLKGLYYLYCIVLH